MTVLLETLMLLLIINPAALQNPQNKRIPRDGLAVPNVHWNVYLSAAFGLSVCLHCVSQSRWRWEVWIVLHVTLNRDSDVVCEYSFLGGEVLKKVLSPLNHKRWNANTLISVLAPLMEVSSSVFMVKKWSMYSTCGMTLKGLNTSCIFNRFSSTLFFRIL